MRILLAAYPLYCVEINKLRYSIPHPLVTRLPQEQRHPELDYPAAAGRSRCLVYGRERLEATPAVAPELGVHVSTTYAT